MATTETKKMSSWWWATHISSRNSKWLQENLADMDSKVKKMIKLIEVDEDSFARRAEMYYKKRPELMNLVEEFYRAYRSLAERYDHSTGVIKHAQRTISEAFPNQINFLDSDDPDFSGQLQGPFLSKKVDQDPSESARLERFEADIQALKEAFSKIEVEKEKGSRLCSLESKVFLEKIDGLERTNASMETELAEMNTYLVKSLFDVHVERQELELKLSQLERELANTKIILCKREMDLIQEQLEVERVAETLRFDQKMRKDEAELWESMACTSFVELQNLSVCELVYREKLFELAEEYQWLVQPQCDGQVQVQPQCDGFLAAIEAIRDALASLERHVISTEVSNGHNETFPQGGITNTPSDLVSDLNDIALRIKAIDDKIKESKSLPEDQPQNMHQHTISNHLNPILEHQEDRDDLALKDIMLDQASENSSSRKNISQTWYDDEQIPIPHTENRYYTNDSIEMPVEKELSVDSLELSKRYTEVTEPKILERLSLDIQKLQSLQKMVHGLKESGHADVKERIKETESAIARLMEDNGKIMKHIQDCEATSSPIGDHVRQWCEKIGRLEVEVEKIRFLVVKLDASNKVDEEPSKKVALRDYLYGSGAHERRRTKAWLCGCVKAKTRRD